MEVMLKGLVASKEERMVDVRVNDEEGGATIKEEDQIESTKAEMGDLRAENERLRTILTRIDKDYRSLQTQFFDIVQQKQAENQSIRHDDIEEAELVSLSLGTGVAVQRNQEKTNISIADDDAMEKGLTLGLDCGYEGSDEPLKIPRNEDGEDHGHANIAKKARVSVRARCDTPTMMDGCQWRKYGQKISKGNPCPRAYYRCTVAPSCPVRKQVQRCPEDMSILTTTYEGNHNHPLPVSATAMASTTSAAACMLLSGSSTTTIDPNLRRPIFGSSDNSLGQQIYLPNPTLSYAPSNPTITLDLTTSSSLSSTTTNTQHSQYGRFYSSQLASNNPRFSSTNFNFSSSESKAGSSNWSFIRQARGFSSQPYFQKSKSTVADQQSLTETISRLFASDPSFQSALASAITSYGGVHGAESFSNLQ